MGMRKVLAVLMTAVFLLAFAGCSGKTNFEYEDFVTMEQLNTEGKYVARGYIESLFLGNREMFVKCFPEGYVDELGKAAGIDVFEQFASATVISGTYMGDACREYRDVTVQNGYDAATFRSRICRVAGCEYSDVGNIQIQKVQVLYKNAKAEKIADFYLTVYEIGGTWYMYELWSIEGF